MSVSGSVKTMSVGDLFEWAARRMVVGELALEQGAVTRTIWFADGAVVRAAASVPHEQLAQLLVNQGMLKESRRREAVAEHGAKEVALGRYLVDARLVLEEKLQETLQLKIREGVYEAMSWIEGGFKFTPDTGKPRPAEVRVAIAIEDLLVEGGRRAERWRQIRAIIPGPETRFYLSDNVWLERAKPGSPSAQILTAVQKGLSVNEILEAHRSLPFPVYQRLTEMVERGILFIERRNVSRPPVEAMSVPDMFTAAQGRAQGGDKAGALDMLKKAIAAGPPGQIDDKVTRLHDELERSVFADLARTLLTRFRVPRLVKPRDEILKLELTPDERALLGRIDGRWDLLSLMRVSPLREVDALLTLSRLASRGVISLE